MLAGEGSTVCDWSPVIPHMGHYDPSYVVEWWHQGIQYSKHGRKGHGLPWPGRTWHRKGLFLAGVNRASWSGVVHRKEGEEMTRVTREFTG